MANRSSRLASITSLVFASLLAGCGSSHRPPTAKTTKTPAPVRLDATLAPWRLPEATSRSVAMLDGSSIVLLGGLVSGDVSTAAVYRIDPGTGVAVRAGGLVRAVHDAAGALISGRALVFGGGSSATVDDVQAWSGGPSAVVSRLPQARSDLASATIGSTTYLLGGFDGTALVPGVLATSDGVQFRDVGRLAQPVRYPAVAVAASRIWVIGGLLGTSESNAGALTDDI